MAECWDGRQSVSVKGGKETVAESDQNRGDRIGKGLKLRFVPLTARFVRPSAPSATECPMTWRFQPSPRERLPAKHASHGSVSHLLIIKT